MAVDTTAIVTGTPSRNVPKTIGGQWQAVKPPWGRLWGTVTDNHRATAYFSNYLHNIPLSSAMILLQSSCSDTTDTEILPLRYSY